MKRLFTTAALAVLLAGAAAAAASPLDALAPFCGKTWKGHFTGPDGTEMTDVSRWELVLGGKAVRTVHSLNDGVYGGETLMYWDPKAETIAYVYVTTAGFRTEGTMTVDGDTFTSHEEVIGNADGITAVRATARLRDDGVMEMTSEYRQDGQWTPGHAVTYTEAPEAEVRFD